MPGLPNHHHGHRRAENMATDTTTQGADYGQKNTLETALKRFCVGKAAEDVYFILAENMDLFLDVAEIMHMGGEDAEVLRGVVKKLREEVTT